ncbi:MAG TPA: hypothetical protein VI306_09025 [Pyrinomonadaceae bacterium]
MAHYLFLLLNILCIILGSFCLVVRLFLYENQQGEIHSKIEDLWLRIDELKPQAISTHVSFMQFVARSVGKLFNSYFGDELVSLEAIIISICFALLTCLISAQLLLLYTHQGWSVFILRYTFLFSVAASVPLFARLAFKDPKKVILIWLAVLGTLTYTEVLSPLVGLIQLTTVSDKLRFAVSFIWAACSCIAIALALYVVSVWIIRKSLRAIETSTSAIRIGVICLFNAVPLLAIYGSVKLFFFVATFSKIDPNINLKDEQEVMTLWQQWGTSIDIILGMLMLVLFFFNSIFIISASLFIGLSVFILLHRLLWPIVSALIYASQRFKIVSEGPVLIVIGVVLILIGFRVYSLIPLTLKF